MSLFTDEQLSLTTRLLARCQQLGFKIATAESCTGGLIVGCLTAVPGSSAVVDRGFVTYTNEAKTDLLGVSKPLLDKVGAVSEAVACAMAEGGLANSNADLCVSVTGIAGPGGGSDSKPVGLIHMSVALKSGTQHARHIFSGDRDAVRQQTLTEALKMMLSLLN